MKKDRFERQKFIFDQVFSKETDQSKLFTDLAHPIMSKFLNEGINGGIFAYGQTGSGKTYSIFGEGTAEKRGLVARSLEMLYE